MQLAAHLVPVAHVFETTYLNDLVPVRADATAAVARLR
jgi:hypothetical protein